MSHGYHRQTAWLACFCYLLASTLSGLWHSHPGAHPASSGVLSADDARCHGHAGLDRCAHEHVGQPVSHDARLASASQSTETAVDAAPGPLAPADDGACSICRFVGQSALAELPLAKTARPEVISAVQVRLPLVVHLVPLWHGLARAPPMIA